MERARDLVRVAGLLVMFMFAFALDLALYALTPIVDLIRGPTGRGDDAIPPGR